MLLDDSAVLFRIINGCRFTGGHQADNEVEQQSNQDRGQGGHAQITDVGKQIDIADTGSQIGGVG